MAPRRITYSLAIAGRELTVHEARGREALSEPSRIHVSARLPVGDTLDTDDVTGGECELTLRSDGAPQRSLRLVAMRVERSASSMADRVFTAVEVDLASPLALAEHRIDIRIFRDLDVPTIVTKVLATFGIAVERRLSGSYAVRPYTVQWRESDLAFVSRLLEDEGIYYRAKDDGGVLLGDSPASYEATGASLPFVPVNGLEAPGEAVVSIGSKGTMAPTKVTMRDFDFKKPKLDVVGSAKVAAAARAGGGEWYEYPAGRLDPGGAAKKASLVAEAFSAAQQRFSGQTSRISLAPNDVLHIDSLPPGFDDGAFAITAVDHDWKDSTQAFSVGFEALESERAFRPMPRTPRPTIVGATVGRVTGAPGDDIHTEEWGRAKVHFHWDRLQPEDNRCSDWIPTLQDNTSHSIGIPRVGWEVVVQHLEGDPDRPVILGRAYTPEDDFYSELPINRMVTTLRSLTSPRSKDGATGENLVEIVDKAGNEHIRFHAERDQVVLTEHDKTEFTGNRDAREVQGHEKIVIGHDRKEDVTLTRHATVHSDQTVTIGHDRKLTVKKQMSEAVTGHRTLSIGSMHMRRFATMDESRLTHDLTEKVGAVALEMCPETNQASTQMAEAVLVGGAMIEVAKQAVSQTAQKLRAEVVGALLFQRAKEHIGLRASTKRTTVVGGNYTGKSGTAVLVSGLVSLEMKVGELLLNAKKKLTLKVQNTTIVLEGDKHSLDAPADITARADGRNDLNAADSGQNDRQGGR